MLEKITGIRKQTGPMRQEFRHTTAKTRRQASALVTRPDLGRSIQHQAACCDLFINPHSICRKLPGRKGGFSCPKMGRTATSAQNPELERVAGAQLRRRLSAQKKTFIAPHRGSISATAHSFLRADARRSNARWHSNGRHGQRVRLRRTRATR